MKRISTMLLGALFLGNAAHAACIYTNTIDVPPAHINASNSRAVFLWMSNNSDSSIDVSLRVYDQNGNDVTDAVQGSGGFRTIAAKGAEKLGIYGNGTTRTIRGELTWSSTTCLTKPMQASLETQWNGSLMVQGVNGGEPF